MAWTRTDRTDTFNSTGAKPSQAGILGNTQFQFIQTGAGGVQVVLEVSNDNASWEIASTITLSSGGDHGYATLVNSWRWYRFNVVSLSATNVICEVSGG